MRSASARNAATARSGSVDSSLEPAGQPLELGGALGQLGDAAVVDQAAAGPRRCAGSRRRRAARRGPPGSMIPCRRERAERVPEVGPQQIRLARRRGRAGGTGRGTRCRPGRPAPRFRSWRGRDGFELAAHRQHLARPVARDRPGSASSARTASVTVLAEAAGREDDPGPRQRQPLPGLRRLRRSSRGTRRASGPAGRRPRAAAAGCRPRRAGRSPSRSPAP